MKPVPSTKGEIRVLAMKLLKRCLVVVGILCVIVSILFGGAYLLGVIFNIQSATIGMACYHLRVVGISIARGLREGNAFPRDCSPGNINPPGGQSKQWYALLNVEQMLHMYGRGESDADISRVYLDPDIWTVVKNLPDNPPSNLIVLATRNVDPSSLRTKLTDEDMCKHIRFRSVKDGLWILKSFAVLVWMARLLLFE